MAGRKKGARGGARGRGGGRPRAVIKSRSQEVACPPGDPSTKRRRRAYPLPFPWLYVVPYPPWPSGLPPVASVVPPRPLSLPVTDPIGARAATCPFPRLNNAARPTWRNIAHEETTTATAAAGSRGVLYGDVATILPHPRARDAHARAKDCKSSLFISFRLAERKADFLIVRPLFRSVKRNVPLTRTPLGLS